jgi:hypothetical protein
MDIKLPKQWKHWCKKAKLRPESTGHWARGKWAHLSVRGLGRRWRIDCYGNLCVSDAERHFDRWANSQVTSVPIPKTEAEFLAAVKTMRDSALLVDAARDNGDYDYHV